MRRTKEKIFFIFDLETNGLPCHSGMNYKFTNNWPGIVQIAWGIYNSNGDNLVFRNYIIKPNKFKISQESSNIHGISHNFANKNGIKIDEIFDDLEEDLIKSDYIVAHNLNFDRNNLLAELTRNNRNDLIHLFESKQHICTLNETINFCRISRSPNGSYKWPKLSELYEKLFNRKIRNAHNAKYDVENLSLCFFKLLKNNEIRL